MLKRMHDLAVLKVMLLPGRGSEKQSAPASSVESNACVSFELCGQWDDESPKTYSVAARDMGIPRYLDQEQLRGRGHYSFRLPPALVAWLEASVRQIELGDRVLWLHLVKPYGYLGMVSWERLLEPVLPTPILRLPDFVIEPPQQTPSLIDVALCCQVGATEDTESIVRLLVTTAKALSASGGARSVRIAILADSALYAGLADAPELKLIDHCSLQKVLPGPAGDSLMTAYVVNPLAAASGFFVNPIRAWLQRLRTPEPKSAFPSTSDLLGAASDPVTSPWLRAVRKALADRSIDLVHVLAHATLSLERGALMLDQSDPNAASPHMVLASEFLAFQAHIGAWAAGFGSPPNNYCDMGLRQFVDNLAQLRPGPVLYQDAATDRDATALGAAYAFLLAEKPSMPPRSPAIFAYCEPFRVRDERQPEESLESSASHHAQTSGLLPQHKGVSTIFQATDNVPSWVAASERFVDMYKLRVAELANKGKGGSNSETTEISATLQRIQDALAKIAGPKS